MMFSRTELVPYLTTTTAILWSLPSSAQTAPTPPPPAPTPSLPSLGSCRSLSLRPVEKDALADLYNQINGFEEAFLKKDKTQFKSLLHPALQRKDSVKDEAFLSTVTNYGLDEVKLVRNAIFALDFSTSKDPFALCGTDKVRGVVGPSRQYGVVHSYLGGDEQVRLFTLYAPISEAQASKRKPRKEHGLVMLHAQVWTHEKKAPDKLLEEARKWWLLDDPLTAWLLAEAGRRILDVNPYLQPSELEQAKAQVSEYETKLPALPKQRELASGAVPDWDFLGYTVIYQTSGVEMGVRFRTRTEETVDDQIDKCRKATASLVKGASTGLRKRFRGVECLAYGPSENLAEPPQGGSQFFAWNKLLDQK